VNGCDCGLWKYEVHFFVLHVRRREARERKNQFRKGRASWRNWNYSSLWDETNSRSQMSKMWPWS